MRSKLKLCLACCWLFAAMALAKTPPAKSEHIDIPGLGQLVLQVPTAWKHRTVHTAQGDSHVLFTPKKGRSFQLALAPTKAPTRAPTPEQMREATVDVAESLAEESGEKTPEVVEFAGPAGPGYYFVMDASEAARANGYKHKTRGTVIVGKLTVNFEIATGDDHAAVVKQVVTLLHGAAHQS
jgi:hypothetical protein